MMYSQDSYGLGHLRRLTNLANELVRRRADLSVLMAVDSPVAPFFELGDRIDFVKLPTIVKKEAGVFQPARLLSSYSTVRTMRSRLLCESVRGFRPHVLVVDHMPGGANGELNEALELVRREGLPTRIVLGLRDIIDDAGVVREMWRRECVYETIERYYDWVMIYGASDVFATAEAYAMPDAILERVQYCGYVCNLEPVKTIDRVRAKMGLGGEPLVVVMAGGGHDGYRLMQTFLDARSLFGDRAGFATLMVTGPFMDDDDRKSLRDQARQMGVEIHSSLGDSLSHIHAADVVVSMAGYNTVCEVLRFGKRAIVVPRSGPSAEQTTRTRLLAERGLVQMLHPRELTPRNLADALSRELAGTRRHQPENTPRLDGVAAASDTLLSFLDRTAPARPAIGRELLRRESASLVPQRT
jgi:predicted glycosyltransferase